MHNRKNLLHVGHLLFKAFVSSAIQIMKEKIIAKTLGRIHPFRISFKFLYQVTCLDTGFFKIMKILTIDSYVTNFLFTDNYKFT